MQNFNELKYFEKYIKDSIKDFSKKNVCFLCEVRAFNDNFSVDVALKNGKEVSLELSNIPILQSAYTQPFIQKGDLGIILPLNNSIYLSLIEKENLYAENETEYIFLPIAKKAQVLGGNGSILGIKSPAGDIVNVGENKLEIETQEISLKADSSLSAESASVSIKSTQPLEIGAGDTIGALINELIDIVGALAPVATSLGSPCTPDPAALVKLIALKTKILASFK